MAATYSYMQIGLKTYKIQPKYRGGFTVWDCKDIATLKYVGERTRRQLIKCYTHGELI